MPSGKAAGHCSFPVRSHYSIATGARQRPDLNTNTKSHLHQTGFYTIIECFIFSGCAFPFVLQP